ncbi:M48 family metallopeptidase [Aciditerrimonas ferrireducens]|uniref:M48 family metallopeptidase n=1 Tax=Aciditerrimonas ferrireducens TaxID=667306 RepID=A0ABV6C0H7_9ACTN
MPLERPGPLPPVEVLRSARRRKYASAYWQQDRIVVVLPERLPRSQQDATVEELVRRVLARRPHLAGSDAELQARAQALADRYVEGVRPRSVRWSTKQRQRWGSCTVETGAIRLSALLQPAPAWVVDAVLVHELAHLLEPTHNARFRQIVGRYERSRDADLFLAGYALGLERAGRAGPSDRCPPAEA